MVELFAVLLFTGTPGIAVPDQNSSRSSGLPTPAKVERARFHGPEPLGGIFTRFASMRPATWRVLLCRPDSLPQSAMGIG